MSTTKNSNPLAKLAELASQLPKGLRSDWRGTNHFELTDITRKFWWLCLSDVVDGMDNPEESEEGQRLGLLMDIAQEVARLKDEGYFDTSNDMLQWVRDKIRQTTDLDGTTDRTLYGAMHILCADHHGMQRYIRAYKCDDKQGVIANLGTALHNAIERLQAAGLNASDLVETLRAADEKLKMRPADANECSPARAPTV